LRQSQRAFNRFKIIVSLISLTVFLITLEIECRRHHGLGEYGILAVFFTLIFFAELWPIKFPGAITEFNMTMPILVGFFLSQGPTNTILVATTSMFAANLFAHRRQPFRWVLNMVALNGSFDCISLAGASVAYLAVGGKTLVQHSAINSMVLPLIVWVGVCTTLNMCLVTTVESLTLHESWRMHARQKLSWYVLNYVITGPSGVLFAFAFQQFGIRGILLMLAPFLVGRKALNQDAVQLDAYIETISTLGSYMQIYHPYTKGHLERVAELADEVAQEVNLPPQSLMFIRNAGLLHDIGKVGVDESVLDKVGKLTNEEWEIIKSHPSRGAEILSQMKYLEIIVPWVRGHHERTDGSGYPDGLRNNQIPLEAAVISVVDAFDAMTGGPEETDKRNYRNPLTHEQAIDQVRLGAGTQFDARVVKAFLKVMARREPEHGE